MRSWDRSLYLGGRAEYGCLQAAAPRTAGGIAAITQAFRHMEREVEGDSTGMDADLDFHRAAGNDQIARVVSFLSDQIRETIMVARTHRGSTVSSVIAVTLSL